MDKGSLGPCCDGHGSPGKYTDAAFKETRQKISVPNPVGSLPHCRAKIELQSLDVCAQNGLRHNIRHVRIPVRAAIAPPALPCITYLSPDAKTYLTRGSSFLPLNPQWRYGFGAGPLPRESC